MEGSEDQRKVALIVIDTLSAFHLPTYGYSRDTAPFLTELAEENTVFRYAYSNAPWTLPSHASLFSGKLPKEHGTTTQSMRFEGETFVEELRDKGVYTLGLSNNGILSDSLGFDKGFDEFICGNEIHYRDKGLTTLAEMDDYEAEYESSRQKYVKFLKKSLKRKDFGSIVEGVKLLKAQKSRGGTKRNYFPDKGADSTNNLVREMLPEKKEFFLFINYNEPHGPYLPPNEIVKDWLEDPEDSKDRVEEADTKAGEGYPEGLEEDVKALYDGEIRYLDQKIKELYDYLSEKHPETVFIITADHGELLGEHGITGHQCGIWEKLIRVPLIVAGKDIEARDISDRNISLRELKDFIMGEKNVEALGNEKVFSEYYGQDGIFRFRDRDMDHFSDEEMHFIENRSRCTVKGTKGYIKNSELDNFGFIAYEDHMDIDNRREECEDIRGEVEPPSEKIVDSIDF